MNSYKEKNLFEISWEVCNKVGGIHTVISSKVPMMKKSVENYFLIGPYFSNNLTEFVVSEIPEKFEEEYNNLKSQGIILHFGNWQIKGFPDVILIEYLPYSKNINFIKRKLWDMGQIDSLNSNFYDFDEAILFSWTAGIAIEKLSNNLTGDILVQSHEWMSGGAIFYLKQLDKTSQTEIVSEGLGQEISKKFLRYDEQDSSEIVSEKNSLNNLNKNRFKTIFTTHATMLGRTISTNEPENYDNLANLDVNKKAYDLGIHTKFQTERALAKISDCFTTVSDITAKEANDIFKKSADVILYNGFNTDVNPNFEEDLAKFEKSRIKTNNFLSGYFNDFYNIDLDNTQIIFTSGRNEFKNKGMDILIDSLGKLNDKLKENNSDESNSKTIITFFIVPITNYNSNSQVINSINNFNKGIKPEFEGIVAPISTHDIDPNNEIVQRLMQNNLMNNINDRVKVIVVPRYLDGVDGVINRSYYEFTRSFDLSIFASNYEPWGYTPLESIVYSIPTITTNLTGFGQYCSIINSTDEIKSVKIINRNKVSDEDSTNQLLQKIEEFTNLNQTELLVQKRAAFDFSKRFDWKLFIENYFRAFEIAKNK